MEPLIQTLHTFPPLLFFVTMILIAYSSVLIFVKLFGISGLYVFISIAIIAANMQVLKITQFSFFRNPVALGTALFASTYLATDILSEFYGEKAAKKGVLIGFVGMLFWTLIVINTLAFAPAKSDVIHKNMQILFLPAPVILIASMSSYLISQFNDVYLFSFLKKCSKGKNLWFRNNVSTLISALLDNIVFSTLAFFILPLFFGGFNVDFKTLIFTFILGTYVFRIVSSLLDTPFIYLAKKILTKPHTSSLL